MCLFLLLLKRRRYKKSLSASFEVMSAAGTAGITTAKNKKRRKGKRTASADKMDDLKRKGKWQFFRVPSAPPLSLPPPPPLPLPFLSRQEQLRAISWLLGAVLSWFGPCFWPNSQGAFTMFRTYDFFPNGKSIRGGKRCIYEEGGSGAQARELAVFVVVEIGSLHWARKKTSQ